MPPLSPRDQEILRNAKSHLQQRVQRYQNLTARAATPQLQGRLAQAAADTTEALAMLNWAENNFSDSPQLPKNSQSTVPQLVWKPFPKPDLRTRGGR